MGAVPEQPWRWVREELPDADFERWLYQHHEEVASALSKDLAFELLELDYRPTSYASRSMRSRLATELPRSCLCPLMADLQGLWGSIGSIPEQKMEQLGICSPWLSLHRCPLCGQHWFVGSDTVDDFIVYARQDAAAARQAQSGGAWPDTFDGWLHLWPQGEPLKPMQVQPARFLWGGLAWRRLLQEHR